MFGYVNVKSPELKVKELEFYRGTYCGLCHSMGKCTGQCSRMTLSYDFVLLALVRFIFKEDHSTISFRQSRCIAHPFKKRNTMNQNSSLDYCADTSAILTYQKTVDDLHDEHGMKKLLARLVFPFVSHARKKAFKHNERLRELDAKVAALLNELSDIESSPTSGVDSPAECFGRLLGEIMSFGLDTGDARIAYEFGRNIGAWIYIADAIDDIPEDIKRGRYNPVVKLYGGRAPTDTELEMISLALKNHLYGAEASFDLMPTEENSVKHIIENIIYLGLTEKIDEITKKQASDDAKESKRKEDGNDRSL